VQIQGGRLLLTPPRSTVDEDILELTSELELHTVEDILELTVEVPTNQTQRQAHVLDSPKPGATGKRTIVPSAKSVEDQDILDLTPDLELNPSKLDEPPTSQRQLQTQAGSPNGAREPRRQEMIASSAASAEQEDILYLTPELELHPPLHPFQRDEAPTNRAQRADEPTREEMIAAMRRFISDE
jgi:hypothetical protein